MRLQEWECRRSLALLQRSSLEGLPQVAELCDKVMAALEDLLQPWMSVQREQHRQTVLQDMRAQWADLWGDPNDPVTQQRIAATVQFLSEG